MDDDEAAGAGGDGASYGLRIDLPALVVDERRGFEAHIVKGGEKVEERISGLCDEDFIAGIAEQAEEEAVRLAGAGGEQQLGGMEGHAVAGVVIRDSLACGETAFGLRIVVEGAGIGEGLEQGGRVGESAAGGIGGGEVGDGQPAWVRRR